MPLNNTVVISAAGSRKTTYIVEQALAQPEKRILIVTYTIENLEQIRRYFIEKNGVVPVHVHIQSWFTFLLHECVRPYQSYLYDGKRIENICFVQGKSAKYVKKDNTAAYYLAGFTDIYTDKISDFACRINEVSGGLIIKRLEGMYDTMYIDEIQDLAGYDLDFLEILFNSQIEMLVVGDNRQATYATNYSPKNSKFKGKNIISLFQAWKAKGLCTIEERVKCYRCNQAICTFADLLYPDMTSAVSMQDADTGHDGIFIVKNSDVGAYIQTYTPRILQYKKNDKTAHLNAINFGASKGLTFERVLIFPTTPISKYLQTGDISQISEKPKLYVAITRAKFSVAFVYDGICFDATAKIFTPPI